MFDVFKNFKLAWKADKLLREEKTYRKPEAADWTREVIKQKSVNKNEHRWKEYYFYYYYCINFKIFKHGQKLRRKNLCADLLLFSPPYVLSESVDLGCVEKSSRHILQY